MRQTVAHLLKKSSPAFTRAQRRVADYLLQRPWEIAFMTTTELAKSTGVSRSGIVRFAKACGFEGYRELQEELRGEARASLLPGDGVRRDLPSLGRGANVIDGVLAHDRGTLEKTLRELDRASYQRAVREMFQASAVYVMGSLSSAPSAHLLAHYLSHVLPAVKLLGVGDASFYRDLRFIGRDDVLAVIAVQPYAKALLEAMKFAKARGAHVLALTDSILSPPAENADVVLTAVVDPKSFAASHVGLLAVIETLVLGIVGRDPARAARHVEVLEQAVRDRGLVA